MTAIPTTMRALLLDRHGGPDAQRIGDIATPRPGPGEALLRVEASALNRLDLWVRAGWPGLSLEMPHVGGSDIAGTVVARGDGVDAALVGRRVVVYPDLSCGRCAWCRGGDVTLCPEHRIIGEHAPGGFAEFAVVPATNLLAVPDGFPAVDAAAAALVFLTAWRMLVTRARLRAGETVLVVGSGGGVNSAAIQIARLAGASRVFVAAGGPQKAERARAIGATDVVDYRTAPFDKEVHRLTARRGVDVVVDNVGKATWERSLRAATRGGRVVTVGGTTGYDPPAFLNQVFWKQLDVIGSTMGTRAEFETVMTLLFAGRLRAVVDRVLPLADGVEAMRALEAGENFGKIVLVP